MRHKTSNLIENAVRWVLGDRQGRLGVLPRMVAALMSLAGILLFSISALGLGVASASGGSGTPAPAGTAVSLGLQSMEGALTIEPGFWVDGGYHFSGGDPGVDITFAGAELTLPVSCSSPGSPAVGSIVVPMDNGPYAAAASGNVPWHDQSSTHPLPWQGGVQAPDLCGGGPMYNSVGATFTADVSSTSSQAISLQWHYRVPAAKGAAADSNCDDPTSPAATNAADCGASESATSHIIPGPPAGPVTQTLAGHIYLCSSGSTTTTEVPGGALAATGPQTVASTPNPLAPTQVAAGTYTMTATAPTGYTLTACGTTDTSPESVVVPSAGSGVGIFYVTPVTQTLAGHIYLCSSGSPTTTEVAGGSIAASGPQTVASTPNPLAPTQVAAGTYTVTATAPDGYTLTACGTSDTSPENVVVPSGGKGVAIFYVTPPAVVLQTISGHIYLCSAGSPTTTEVPGGALAATGPQTVASTPNPLSPTDVKAGTYTMTATAPAGYILTACGTTHTSPESVVVPTGGSGVGVFYVTPSAPPGITLTVTKANDASGTGVYAQTETATAAGENVGFKVVVTNTSTTPIDITGLTDSWPGQAPFSPGCASSLAGTALQPGAAATCFFTVDDYAPAPGHSLTDTVQVTGCLVSNPTTCATAPATSMVITPAVTASAVVKTSPPPPSTPPSSALAFTGAPAELKLLLAIGLGLMSAGMFMLWLTRPRRPAVA